MSRFDQHTADTLLVAVRAGASTEVAAMHAGIPTHTAYDWLAGGTPAKDKFKRDVDKARADLELLAVGTVRRAMSSDDPREATEAGKWVAEMAWTERRFDRLRELTT
jgi:hypothetical protein